MGVSHVYTSPIATARAGSAHGYDIVDHRINPALGGEDGFRKLAERIRDVGMGTIIDVVPNHMAVGGGDNIAWLDLLQNGRASLFAGWFDIDFDGGDIGLKGKVHAPFLGLPYRQSLCEGHIKLGKACNVDGYAALAGDNVFPLTLADSAGIEANGIAAYENPECLHRLLSRQNFVLDWWRNAGDRINWRRFFDVTTLAAIRMEHAPAFEAVHATAFALYREGLIDGVRVDHIDGLANPKNYCLQLRDRLENRSAGRIAGVGQDRAWIVVEKILAPGETLPSDWSVEGTTGYDFMDQVSALQHAPDGLDVLARYWRDVSDRPADFSAEQSLARRQILSSAFNGQLCRLAAKIVEEVPDPLASQAVTHAAAARALAAVFANFRVYRTYQNGDREPIQVALAAARQDPFADPGALDLIAAALDGNDNSVELRHSIATQFNEISAPLAAKAIEDTAFYRYGRLLSRNDVGFDPGNAGITIEHFHIEMAERARLSPHSMLATATHDHKRGEDVRARLAVLSEMPHAWIAASHRWFQLNAAVRPSGIEAGDEYQLYQMLAGAWPLDLDPHDRSGLTVFAGRITGWWIKALREAKLTTGWLNPNETYEMASRQFVANLLKREVSTPFIDDLAGFVATIGGIGAMNGLVQTALRCTLPGVPDTYQGTELWDFSLVDPDNRRPVDFAARTLQAHNTCGVSSLIPSWKDGRVKQSLLRELLTARANHSAVFERGNYVPLTVSGTRKENVVAFMRRGNDAAVIVACAIRAATGFSAKTAIAPEAQWWGDTKLQLPSAAMRWRQIVGGASNVGPAGRLADALDGGPVAVWSVDLE